MNERVDIIIPIYNQRQFLPRCLASIAAQSIVSDCDITIVNDGSDEDYSDIIQFYQQFFSIFEIKLGTNKGPGIARQMGINITHNPYIIFIDADDQFENIYAIEYLRGLAARPKEIQPAAVFTSFVEECSNGRKVVHQKDNTWLFGKIYNREFLDRNNIIFSSGRENEDKGFNCAVMLCAKKKNENDVQRINRITYSWKWNECSITRKNNFEYKSKDLYGFVNNTIFALDIAKRAEVEDQYICLQAASTLSYLYYRYIENFKTKDYSQEDIKQICRKFYSYTFSFDLSNFLSAALASQKENFLERGLKEEDITSFPFDQFILDIK